MEDGSVLYFSGLKSILTYYASTFVIGQAPLGYGDLSWLVNTTLNVGPNKKNIKTTYYFRKTFQVDDANCYFKINSTILAKDGLVSVPTAS